MKVLVTGGAGYIGSHTCKELAQQGHEVVVYDNLSTGHRRFVKWGDFCHGDILDTQRLYACLREYKPDGIIHFAAWSYVGESVVNPGKYFRNNVAGTLSILEAMRDAGIGHIVVSGTCAVYGQPNIVPIGEQCPTAPINPYGASKLFMERMLEDFYTAHGIQWMSLRYFNASGADPDGDLWEDHSPETHLVPRVVMAAKGHLPEVQIFGNDYPTPDGTCIRDYVHVCDLARAHILAMRYLMENDTQQATNLHTGKGLLSNADKGRLVCQALNLGTGRGYSVLEIIRSVEDALGIKVPHSFGSRRAGDPPLLIADAHRAQAVLGWEALMHPLAHIV